MQLASKVTEIRQTESLVCISLVSVRNPAEGRRSQTSWTPENFWFGMAECESWRAVLHPTFQKNPKQHKSFF